MSGTVLNRHMAPLFQGSDEEIMEFIMAYPLVVESVWISGQTAPISIDEWTKRLDERGFY
jgi:hypothetical protein